MRKLYNIQYITDVNIHAGPHASLDYVCWYDQFMGIPCHQNGALSTFSIILLT